MLSAHLRGGKRKDMKTTKNIRIELFNNALNNSLRWRTNADKNYTNVWDVIPKTSHVRNVSSIIEEYFDKEIERSGELSSFFSSLYWDCKEFEIALYREYFKFGFISETELNEHIAKNECYM